MEAKGTQGLKALATVSVFLEKECLCLKHLNKSTFKPKAFTVHHWWAQMTDPQQLQFYTFSNKSTRQQSELNTF